MQEVTLLTYEDWKMLASDHTNLWKLRANIVKYMKKGYIPLGPPKIIAKVGEREGSRRGFDFFQAMILPSNVKKIQTPNSVETASETSQKTQLNLNHQIEDEKEKVLP